MSKREASSSGDQAKKWSIILMRCILKFTCNHYNHSTIRYWWMGRTLVFCSKSFL